MEHVLHHCQMEMPFKSSGLGNRKSHPILAVATE